MQLRLTLVSLTLAIALGGTACGGDDETTSETNLDVGVVDEQVVTRENISTTTDALVRESAAGVRHQPAVGASWQWQLSGELDTSHDVDVYDIDLFDVPTSTIAELRRDGRHVVCYFSAGSVEDWRDDVEAFAPSDVGEPLDGWEGERWLDVRSPDVVEVMVARLDLARSKGCDGVEPDNVTAYRNVTGFEISVDDQLAYNRALAEAAHDRGLSIGLKNGGELVADLVELFDFSVNEECHEYDECELYAAFVDAGKPVFNAEYRDDWAEDPSARAELCERANAAGLSTLVLPIELDGSFRHPC